MGLLSQLSDIATSISSFATDVTSRFDTGVLGFLTYMMVSSVKYMILAKIYIMTFAINIAWTVASELLNGIGLFPMINQALYGLSPEVAGMLDLLGINQSFNIIITALIAKFVLRFVPFGP